MKQREIKFRAWDMDKKIMAHDFDQSLSVHYPKRLTLGASIHSLVWDIGLVYETLMQYAGLKDKNGKEIYEGDIMKTIYGNYAVEFFMGRFEYENFDHYGVNGESPDLEEGEVIGNIYENAGLLAAAP